ncbi:hypothetical protein NEOKW01_0860 [Nematocida sp. AWRm80]|nr:hypothetical protein NEOKW01_0860 [Nematocida sp. AWRm80]
MSTGILSGYFNLLKTIIGSGIVTYPVLFATFGILPGIFFSLTAGILTFFGLLMLCECASFQGNNKKTFSSALEDVWPAVSKVFNVIVFAKCFGVSLSYLVLVKSHLEYLIKDRLEINIAKEYLIVVYALILLPICSMKDIKSLKYSSLLGLIGVGVFIGGAITNMILIRSTTGLAQVDWIRPPQLKWITRAGQLVFSFTCHQNIFSIRASLRSPTKNNIIKVIGPAIGSALSLYLLFGLVMYFACGSTVSDNAFASFTNGTVKDVVVVFYILLVSCSYPLQVYPARDCLSEWTSTMIHPREEAQDTIRILSTVVIIIAGLLISLIETQIDTIQTIVGGSASTLMCNIIPPICMLRLHKKKSFLDLLLVNLLLFYGLIAFLGVCIKLAIPSI